MKQALPNAGGPVFQLSDAMIQNGLDASRLSPRKRIILPLHRMQEAEVQRMLNFLQPGTYIRPHKHNRAHASESIVVLQGSLVFIIFDEDGNPIQYLNSHSGHPSAVIDIEPDVWHSFVVTEPDTILFEAKKGPYSPMLDKEFAPWAPEEFTPDAAGYLKKMTGLNGSS